MFEGVFQPMHLILILFIVLIIFGPGKLPEVGRSLGSAVKDFKKAMADESKSARVADGEDTPAQLTAAEAKK